MAFKPFLVGVNYIKETDTVSVVVEHRDGGIILTRTYQRTLPVTISVFKTVVLDANQALNDIVKPTIITTLEGYIGTEIE